MLPCPEGYVARRRRSHWDTSLTPLLRSPFRKTRDLTDDSSELRLLLCKKKDGVASQNTVLSAAGIYVKDIIKAAPIVKYFDLFKSVSVLFSSLQSLRSARVLLS